MPDDTARPLREVWVPRYILKGGINMRDLYELESTPCEEKCVQVTKEGGYEEAMRAECRRYADMLSDRFQGLPEGTYFRVKSCSHDFGTYYEVTFSYDDDIETHVKAMVFVDNNLPKTWNDTAVLEFKPEAVIAE